MKHALVALLVVAAAAGSASAQPAPAVPDTAAGHYEQGRRLYDIKEYDAAIAEFKRAYTMDPDPVYLFNLAQAYRLKGDCTSAAEFFRKFLKADPTTDRRDKIEKLIAECVPGEAASTTGPVAAADAAQPVQPPLPPPPVDRDRGRSRRIIGIATAATGVVLLGTGALLGASASNIASDIESECAVHCDWAEVRGRDSTGRTRATLSTVAFVTGGVALAGGVALYFWGRSLGHETPPVAIIPTADGAIATTAFSF